MKSIILKEQTVEGVKLVTEVTHGVDADYASPKPILTDAVIPKLEPKFGKEVYLGYDEQDDEFVVVYKDRPLTENEKTEQRIKANEEALLDLMDLQIGGSL